MNIIAQIDKYDLRPEGGLYRPLPLFTLSCICRGYNGQIKRIAGLSYGPIGAYGNRDGWRTVMDINKVIDNISKKLSNNKSWLTITRRRSKKAHNIFLHAIARQEEYSQNDPWRILRFMLTAYPKYLASIGTYNLFMRYLEYANSTQAVFPRMNLQILGLERDRIADIYPQCEKLIRKSLSRISKQFEAPAGKLSMMTWSEMRSTVYQKRLAVSIEELQKRTKGFVYLFTAQQERVTANVHMVKKARSQWPAIKRTTSCLQGRPVYPGKITGTVIRTLKRNIWPKRPVYVAVMTRTDDAHSADRLKAIVTDEGGVLCHAAVLAREFEIPCIVGARQATRLFKNGDRIEVDATKGVVRKI